MAHKTPVLKRPQHTSILWRFTRYLIAILACIGMTACSTGKLIQNNDAETKSQKKSADIYSDYLSRDVRDDVFYFVLPDRFDNGDPSNDNGSDEHAISFGGFDPTNKGFFHGGDLQGLKKRLGYLKEMGVTAIWMTPILRNKAIQRDSTAYHGYWIVDFTQIDPHFGSNADLKDLIDSAHDIGMKVFFDIITNHTADVVKYRECHTAKGLYINEDENTCPFKSIADLASGKEKPYTTFIPEDEALVRFPAWLNDKKYYHNQGDSYWQGESSLNGDFSGLDDLNTEMPEVISGMIDIYNDIITEFRPDGFRIDTVKHVQLPFWQAFVPAVMGHAKDQGIPNFHMFGEVYDGDPAFLSTFTTTGKMPAILDFGFQGNAGAVFANTDSPEKLESLFTDDDYYSDNDSQADLLLSFIGNHDMGRYGFFLNSNFPEASDAEKMQRSIVTHALMYFSRGIPVVYYGDEQGFTGDGNDMAAREDMMRSKVDSYNDNNLLGTDATTAAENFDRSHPIYLSLKEFAEIYQGHKALRRGVHHNRHADKASGIYAFSRVDIKEKVEYLLVFNSSTETKSVTLAATSEGYSAIAGKTQDVTVVDEKVIIEVPALQYAIYKANSGIKSENSLMVSLKNVKSDERSPAFIGVDFEVKGASELAIPLYAVSTEYKTKSGEYTLASTDYTYPYRSKISLDSIAGGLNGEIRVTVDNLAGKVQSRMFSLSQ